MKKLILLCCATVFLNSCENDRNDVVASTSKLINIEKFTETEIGNEVNGEFHFTATKTSILKTFKDLVQVDSENRPLEPQSIKIETIDGKKFLRILSKNNYVSTVELVLKPNYKYYTQSTVCSSTACASGGGCIPDGSYCTPCRVGINGSLRGDCTRTTTALTPNDPGFTHP